MPVTKTAKRALRSSKKKAFVNKEMRARLEIAIRQANSKSTTKNISTAVSLTDRATKIGLIHRNKAARIKSKLSKLLSQKSPKLTSKKRVSKKSSTRKASK